MDEQKDIQGLKTAENAVINRSKVSVLKNDALVNFAYKKTEKITTALYMVTGLLPDVEPMKWKIREKGLLLLSHILSLGSSSKPVSGERETEALTLIVEQMSLLEVASLSGGISEMNYTVLEREYEHVGHLIHKIQQRRKTGGRDGFALPGDFFTLPREQALADLFEQSDRIAFLKRTETESSGTRKETKVELSQSISDVQSGKNIPPQPIAVSSGQSQKSRLVAENFRSKGRRETIIAYLRDHEHAGIKEIARIVRGCGEKTVQREILWLVQEGIVKKEGERRWSTYSLVS